MKDLKCMKQTKSNKKLERIQKKNPFNIIKKGKIRNENEKVKVMEVKEQ